MEKNETLITAEVFETIVNQVTREMSELKIKQGNTINSIANEKEILKSLKTKLKSIKKDIRETKTNIRSEKRNLRTINNALDTRRNNIIDLENSFVREEETYVDLNVFSNSENSPKKR